MRPVNGYFDEFGGKFIPETLMPAVCELEKSFYFFIKDKSFNKELNNLFYNYAGRPTPLTYAPNISKDLGFKVYLKREDLCHTGSHKINNALGQALLAKKMGKTRVIAETGAGQHGVATATVCALLGLKCEVYMGTCDIERQKLNVFRMELLGAKVTPVSSGNKILKDAITEALRDWMANVDNTYYLLGSVLGPHPYPLMIRHFQSIIGIETKKQIIQKEKRLPDVLLACVGGGSNSIGLFYSFLKDKDVKMYGIEAGGRGFKAGEHASRFKGGSIGILHGTRTYILQDEWGQILPTHSISAGLDYPAIGPEHSYLKKTNRIKFDSVNDKETLDAFSYLSEKEGIMPALESAHAIAYLFKLKLKKGSIVIVNLSGRGDKDIDIVYKDYYG
ncbi:MAG: tryptophan synthase subunit beta [Candidatus Hydrogenedentota bacterium]